MRRVRYSVAMSLDGYIAGPGGEYDWIIMDPAIDFAAMFAEFDTVLLGRRTFEASAGQTSGGELFGMKAVVFSRTMQRANHPGITFFGDDAARAVAELKAQDGKDIWLMGGGVLFGSLLEAGLVDSVEVAVIPVLLGGGIPMLPAPCKQVKLALESSKALPTGIVMLTYRVTQGA
jgi:dihydrofolate reductase